MNVANNILRSSAEESLKYYNSTYGESPKTIFDIGACVGLYSLNIANMSKDSKVYAFEPVKESFDIMEENIELNSIENIIQIKNIR